LIITADDFGLNEPINRGVEECLRRNRITSVSLIPNGPEFEHAVAIADQLDVPVGVHLGLVQEQPVSDEFSGPDLLDSSGRLPANYKQFCKKWFTGRMDPETVSGEIRAQIQKVLDTGLTVTHVDSHQHIHMLPGIYSIVCDQANEFQIQGIRLSDELLVNSGFPGVALGGLKLLSKWNRVRRSRNNLAVNDYFYGISQWGPPDRQRTRRLFGSLPGDSITEFGLHLSKTAVSDPSRIHPSRDLKGVYDWLMSDQFLERLDEYSVRLSSWEQLS